MSEVSVITKAGNKEDVPDIGTGIEHIRKAKLDMGLLDY